MKRISAPCWAVFPLALAAIAAEVSEGRLNSNVFMVAFSHPLSLFAYLLNGRHDVGVRATAADVAAHQFFDVGIERTARFFQQCDGRHDLARRAITALITIALEERSLHGVHRFGRAQTFDGRDL